MSTIHDKLATMVATVREMRKILANQERSPKNGIREMIMQKITANSPMGQTRLLESVSGVSSRTVRRHLDALVASGRVTRQKQGREVVYLKNGNYPQ